MSRGGPNQEVKVLEKNTSRDGVAFINFGLPAAKPYTWHSDPGGTSPVICATSKKLTLSPSTLLRRSGGMILLTAYSTCSSFMLPFSKTRDPFSSLTAAGSFETSDLSSKPADSAPLMIGVICLSTNSII